MNRNKSILDDEYCPSCYADFLEERAQCADIIVESMYKRKKIRAAVFSALGLKVPGKKKFKKICFSPEHEAALIVQIENAAQSRIDLATALSKIPVESVAFECGVRRFCNMMQGVNGW